MQAKLIFFEHLKIEFVPKLVSLGFTGNEQTYRRMTGEVINVIHIQEHHDRQRCCVNMGLHLKFLPASWARHSLNKDKLTASDCEFQRFLTLPGKSEYWWRYSRWFQSPARNAEKLMATYLDQGETLFGRYKSPQDFSTLFTPEDFITGGWRKAPHGFKPQRGALTMARIHLHLGDADAAKAYARAGVELVAPTTALAAEYRSILDSN